MADNNGNGGGGGGTAEAAGWLVGLAALLAIIVFGSTILSWFVQLRTGKPEPPVVRLADDQMREIAASRGGKIITPATPPESRREPMTPAEREAAKMRLAKN